MDSHGKSRRDRHRKQSESGSDDSFKNPSEEEIKKYMVKKAQKKALHAAKKLKTQSVCGYSNDSNQFGDSNLTETFVWLKKIEKDVHHHGVPLDEFSVKAEKRRREEMMSELEKVKKRREQRVVEKARHEEKLALLAREGTARAEFQDMEENEEEINNTNHSYAEEAIQPAHVEDNFNLDAMGAMEEGDDVLGSSAEVNLYWLHDKYRLRKPKYFNRVHTGYEWNKYNKTHYDHDNPPPKNVQGYKFNIFYPDLVDETKAPIYTIEKDGTSDETCMIRFHAAPPYQDIAFRIVNKEWEYSHKNGFKCAFERGILKLYVNIKRHPYRR